MVGYLALIGILVIFFIRDIFNCRGVHGVHSAAGLVVTYA